MTQKMTPEQKEYYLRALRDVDDMLVGHIMNLDNRNEAGVIAHLESLKDAINDLRETE